MGRGLAGISRRLLLRRAAAAAAAAALAPLTAAAAQAQVQVQIQAPAGERFHAVRLRKSSAAGYLQELRQRGACLSQLVLEGGGHCLIIAAEQTNTGARRLEL